ncbi:FAD-dependent oxidoreductase [Candidatus Saganbacteria bacterium]|nr:FAD-dependent oxidoreductase [Candidatus Saganbacteria bacterium]
MYDLIILGAGPAGITAAVYAARKRLNFMVVTRDIGGQAAISGDIENYTGYQFITGPDLAKKFADHLKQFSFPLKEGEAVRQVKKLADKAFKVITDQGEYEGKALIVATGKIPRPLRVPGEAKFKNRGVSYCATCDGPLFAGKSVAVIGGGNSALDAALSLAKIAKQVYLVNINPRFTGDPIMEEKLRAADNVVILNGANTLKINGDKFVTGIEVKIGGETKTLPVQGVFVEAGLTPNSAFIEFVDKNKAGEIEVNCATETSEPGVFAAGDVTTVPDKQIIIAAGEGSKAALRAFRYLAELK